MVNSDWFLPNMLNLANNGGIETLISSWLVEVDDGKSLFSMLIQIRVANGD